MVGHQSHAYHPSFGHSAMMLLGAVVQGFAGSARPGPAPLGSARSAVSMATGNPIGAILEKAGIDIPGPDISGLPPQVARAIVPRSAHHSPLITSHQSPVASHHSPLSTHHSPLTLTTHHSLPTAHSPPTAHRPLLTTTQGVVITGGAGGVGYAYADSFMARGHSVVICDVRDPEAAVAALQQKHAGGSGKVYGCVCDVCRTGLEPQTSRPQAGLALARSHARTLALNR